MGNIIITGAGTGLGRALALRYAKAGHTVYLTGRTEKKLLLVQKEIKEKGGTAEVLICDVTEQSSVSEALRQVDTVDVLINNAGLGIFGDLSSFTEDDIDRMFNTNIKGTILMTQTALPKLEQVDGKVLNIISTAGLRGKKNESIYCASKFAVRGFTESLHKEWEDKNVSATAVYMGGMNTPFWHESMHISNPNRLKGPDVVADQIFIEDDGRKEIVVDR